MGKLNAVASRNRDFSTNVPAWKEEYWSIDDANYERARVERWGGGGWYEDDEEREPNSDTDGPSEDGDEEESENEVEEQSDDGARRLAF